MKQVIINPVVNGSKSIPVSNCTKDLFYGVRRHVDQEKMFIFANRENGINMYVVKKATDLMKAHTGLSSSDLRGLIQVHIGDKDKVYAFKDIESLILWLYNGNNTGVEVVKDNPFDTVSVDDTSADRYYGILNGSGEYSVGFVTRQDFASGNFCAVCTDGVTNGNCYLNAKLNAKPSTSIKTFLGNTLTSRKDVKVFEFETDAELFSWVAKETANIKK